MSPSSLEVETKKCGHCGETKPVTEFYSHVRDKYQSWCKDCSKKEYKRRYYTDLRYRAQRCLDRAQRHANKKNLVCTITVDWVLERFERPCALSNKPFNLSPGRTFDSPSIDRKNNDLGYTPENSHVIWDCLNSFKGQMTLDQMFKVAKIFVINYSLMKGETNDEESFNSAFGNDDRFDIRIYKPH